MVFRHFWLGACASFDGEHGADDRANVAAGNVESVLAAAGGDDDRLALFGGRDGKGSLEATYWPPRLIGGIFFQSTNRGVSVSLIHASCCPLPHSEWASAFKGLPEPLREALNGETSPLTCGGLIDTTESFLVSAQRDGLARDDVGGRELFLSVLAPVWVSSARLADLSSASALRSLIKSGWAAEYPR